MGRKLVLPYTLEVGVGLREAVQKACKLNGIANTAVALELAGCRSAARLSALALSDNVADLQAVSEVLGIRGESEQLARVLTPSGKPGREFVSFFGHHVRRGNIARTRRIAPRSLLSGLQMNSMWTLKPLSFDPATRERLLDRCPTCGSYLGWEASYDPWICEQCLVSAPGVADAGDLRAISMPVFEPTDPEALDYVAYMLDPVAQNKRVCLPKGSVFERMPAGDMFQLAVRIALTCQRAQKPASGLPIEPEFIEMAGRAILNWPEGFVELVENTQSPKNDEKSAGWFKEKPLRQLLFDPSLTTEIRQEIKKLVEANRRLEVLARPSVIGTSSANDNTCRGLRQPRSALFNLLRSETADPHTDSSLATIITVLRDIKEVRQFSRATAVTVPDVWRLFTSGLAPELGPVLEKYGWRPPKIFEGTLRENLDRVIRPGMGVGTMGIVSARFALDHQMKSSWVSILRAVVDGRLTVWRDEGERGLVGSLVLNDFECLRAVLTQVDGGGDDADVEVTQEELSMFMRKSRPYAAHFVQSGIMSGPTNIRSFANVRRNWAFGFELEALCAITRLPSLSEKVRRSGVDRIDCGPAKMWSRKQSLELLGLSGA